MHLQQPLEKLQHHLTCQRFVQIPTAAVRPVLTSFMKTRIKRFINVAINSGIDIFNESVNRHSRESVSSLDR